MDGSKKSPLSLRVKLSVIQFPEVCPVCLEEPEDLVFITIMERAYDEYASSSWNKQQDKMSVALKAAEGAITFSVPTCMRHGSKSVRTLRTKLISALGFFVLFYPILFFLLQINVALNYSRDLLQPILGLVATTGLLIVILLYSLIPRALERAIRFREVSRVKDSVLLSFSNMEYYALFLNLNEMNAVIVNDKKDGTND
ncbi:MAG: hypothetical protein AM326_11790 [Candidatus Thorarchaeota archaeon SMTZ-45]|nr:MAG: hypothetical protein AM326_11790 [Candidatus Thorarchaeota archaeon SMTZ-45]KXH72383.1 MAG: hypothetical protein AM325_14335 [Candidatus Thorarchaeota archaeon SMTZ1-45]